MAFAELFLKIKALIMMPFITKYLGTVNYGIWSQVMVIVSLLSPLVFCGMDNSLARFLPGKPIEQQRKDFTGWFLYGLFSGIVIFSCVGILENQLSELFFGNDGIYPNFVILAGLNIVTTSLLTGIRNWFRIQNNAWSLITITITQNLAQMGCLIWILIMKYGIYELVLWSLVVDSALILSYIIYMARSKIFTIPSWEWFKPYFRFGLHFLPSGYAVWVLNSVDRVFLAQYHTLSDIGIYSICFTIGYTLIQVIVNPIWSLFPTKAAELYNLNNIRELDTLFNQSIKLICWLIFPSILGLVLVGDQLLMILSTNEFASGYLVIPIILLGYLLFMLSSYFELILSLRNKPLLSTIFTVLACAANIVLNFVFIPKFSYMGAAIATTLSFGLQLLMSSIYALKENLVTLDKRTISKIIIASIIMYLMTFFVKTYFIHNTGILSLFLLVGFGCIIYLFLTLTLKLYRPQDVLNAIKGDVIRV